MRLKRSEGHSNSQFKLGHSVAGQRRSTLDSNLASNTDPKYPFWVIFGSQRS